MSRYAQGTTVSAERSKAEVDRILTQAGATTVGIVRREHEIIVGFELQERAIKIPIHLPSTKELYKKAEAEPPWGWKSKSDTQRRHWCEEKQEEEARRRWRVLVILLKAKLEAIADDCSTIEQEFLYFVTVKGGRTIGENLEESLQELYSGAHAPKLLLGMGSK